jgi:hypothetical protein
MGLVRIEEPACSNHLAGNVIEDVTHEVYEQGLDRLGDLICFPDRPCDDVVVDGSVLPVLHQSEHLVLDHIVGIQPAPCQDEAVQIVTIGGGRIQHEPMGVPVRDLTVP